MTWLRRARRRDEITQPIRLPRPVGRVPRPPAAAFVGPWPVDGWTVHLCAGKGSNRVRLLLRDHLGVPLSCVEWTTNDLRDMLADPRHGLNGRFHGGVCHHLFASAGPQ